MKRIISFILTAVMLFTSLSVFAFAEEQTSGGYDNEYGKIEWTYDKDTKTLNITGTGILKYDKWPSTVEHAVIGEGITELYSNVFYDDWDSKLKTVLLPTTLKKIGLCAFQNTNLESVIIPEGVTTIDSGAFCDCKKLTSVTLPSTLEEIRDQAFYLTAITSVDIPENVKIIKDEAFAFCANLYFVTLPENLEFIGDDVFSGTEFMNSLYDDDYSCYAGKYLLSLGENFNNQEERTVRYGTTVIAEGVIENETIKKLNIPNTVKYICDDHSYINNALLNSGIDEDDYDSYEYIDIEKCIDEICYLGTVEQWSQVKFSSPKKTNPKITILGKEIIPEEKINPEYGNNPEDMSDVAGGYDNEYGKISWTYDKATKTLNITGTGILKRAGWPINEIENVVIGEGITKLGMFIFSGEPLKSITLPHTLETIGMGAFSSTRMLKEIILPDSLKTIDYEAFRNSSIESIVIPEGVETVRPGVFCFCDSLTSVTLPSTLKEISDCLFYDCEALTSVVIPDSIKTIRDAAFFYCKNLSTVTLPKNMEFIGRSVFYNTIYIKNIPYDNNGHYVGTYLLSYKSPGLASNLEYTVKEGTTLIAKGNILYLENNSTSKLTIPASVKYICEENYYYYLYYENYLDRITYNNPPDCIKKIYYLGTEKQWSEVQMNKLENCSTEIFILGKENTEDTDDTVGKDDTTGKEDTAGKDDTTGKDDVTDNTVTVSHKFADVKKGAWYNAAVDYCYANGYIKGITDTKFGIDTAVTRGMFVTILARMSGVDTKSNKVETKFNDVKSGKYYTAAIKWASENGIVAGMTKTTFEPESALERQQLCLMIVNFAKHKNITLTEKEGTISFTDADKIGKWAKDAVTVCQKADIVNGYNENGKTLFKPKHTATRAEAAQILYVFHSEFAVK